MLWWFYFALMYPAQPNLRLFLIGSAKRLRSIKHIVVIETYGTASIRQQTMVL